MKVFLAGATGAMGQAMVPQLIEAGHTRHWDYAAQGGR